MAEGVIAPALAQLRPVTVTTTLNTTIRPTDNKNNHQHSPRHNETSGFQLKEDIKRKSNQSKLWLQTKQTYTTNQRLVPNWLYVFQFSQGQFYLKASVSPLNVERLVRFLGEQNNLNLNFMVDDIWNLISKKRWFTFTWVSGSQKQLNT